MTTLPSWAYVGAEVICVEHGPVTPHQIGYQGVLPPKGVTLKISSRPRWDNDFSCWRVCIEGFPNATPFGEDSGWALQRFQPVKRITLEQDMEIFAPLLKTQKESEFV